MSTEDRDLLKLEDCVGSLKWGEAAEAELPITFGLKIQKSGQGLIEIRSSNPAAIGPLSTLHRNLRTFCIIAEDPEGQSIHVSDADISNLKIGSSKVKQQYEISSTVTIRRMSINLNESFESAEGEPKRAAEYFVKGLVKTLFFSARLAPWSVSMNSENKAESPDTASARMLIELDDNAADHVGRDFTAECDELAERVLEVLSVSVGTSLAWSVRKTLVAGLPIHLFFRSTQVVMAPAFPMFHNLNLAPALDLALSRHTPELRKERGLDVAIYWSLNYSPRAEAHYLHLMTALEHMVSRYTEGRSKARFDKSKFTDKIRPALLAAAVTLEEQGLISKADLKFIDGKLGDLNRMSLRDGIEGMLTEWRVRFEDLMSIASLGDLITIRNRITHQGALPEYGDNPIFWDCLDVLIELLKRIFMSSWAYQGRYISHLGTYHEASYPPEVIAKT